MQGDRNKERAKFGALVQDKSTKIQVGARGSKIGPDWIAIDLFDKSPLIDQNLDLQALPYEDCSVDCYVCNAVLEHVFEPQLAIFEMYRTLKVGGLIWVEVPFNQLYHAHPYDFRRWTVQGLKWEMRRFEPRSVGVSGDITREVRHISKVIQSESSMPKIDEASLQAVEDALSQYVKTTKLLRMYSGTFFWGEKKSHEIDAVEVEYMARLRQSVLAATVTV